MSFMSVAFCTFDALGHAVQIVLNQDALLARSLITSLRQLLAPMHIVINLAKTQVLKSTSRSEDAHVKQHPTSRTIEISRLKTCNL